MMGLVDKILVKNYWNKMTKEKKALFHWSDSSIVLEYINRCISNDLKVGWLQYACQKYLIKNGRGVLKGLSIGCGSGELERQCIRMGACREMEAFDIAPAAIKEAERQAKIEKIGGLVYKVKNLEALRLTVREYDVIFASSAVHHVKNLERLFVELLTSLKPNGFFIMLEYIGPSQFQFSQKVVDIINEILQTLPSQYKELSSNPSKFKESFDVTPIEWMNKHDPSEAIRSAEIIPLLNKYFTIIERKDFGGTILHMLLQGIVANFNHHDYKDVQLFSVNNCNL